MNKEELEQKEGKFLNNLELRLLNSFVLLIIVVCSSQWICSSFVKMVGDSLKKEKSVEERLLEEEEEPTEEKEVKKKKTETAKRLTKEEKENLRTELREGKVLQKDLAVKYGISFEYVSKLAKKWGYSRDVKAAEKELIDKSAVEDHITKATTKLVQEEATIRIDEILDTGKYCIDSFNYKATARGFKLPDYLNKCVEFYETYNEQVQKLNEDLDLYEQAIILILREADPRVMQLKKNRDIRDAVFSQILINGKVQEELLKAFLHT